MTIPASNVSELQGSTKKNETRIKDKEIMNDSFIKE